MKHNRFLLVTASLIMILSMLAGCGSPATPAPQATQPPAAAQPTSPPASTGPVVVQYWSNGWFPSAIDGRKALVDKFNAEYKGKIEIQYVQGNWDNGEQYLQNGIAAGGGIACIVEWYVDGALDWYRKGYVQDLRPFITPEIQGYMDDAQWKARTADDGAVVITGSVLGAPILTLLYNPDYLQAAGITPATAENPWTWEQLFENAKLLTVDKNGKHLGEDGFDKDNVVHWGLVERLDNEKVWEYGLTFAQNRMGKAVVRQENGTWGWFLDDAAAADYERFLTPIAAGITPDAAIGLTGDTQEQMLADGTAAIIMRETFAIPTIHTNYPNAKIDVMPIPFEKGEAWYYQAGGEGMVMTKTCDHPKEAAEYLFWLMKPENNAIYGYGNYMAPANAKAMDYDPFKSDPQWNIIRNYMATGKSFVSPFNVNLPEFRDTIASPTLMDVASGKITFAEANKILSEQAKTILNK
jgi:multiple sugar transport system substrate-binding protein